ncbi:hypothetical protein [Campylobacter blaseri]|nr:hypothetical protein [Campylobacter blaseri]
MFLFNVGFSWKIRGIVKDIVWFAGGVSLSELYYIKIANVGY